MFSGKSYEDIVYLEVGITNQAGSGYKVKYNFSKNLITWNDGYMWNNNFMKHMNADKLEIIHNKLPKTNLFNWMEGYIEGNKDQFGYVTANPSSWEVVIIFKDDSRASFESTQHFPNDWNLLKVLIEETTGCTFRLR